MKPFCIRTAIFDLSSANSNLERRYVPLRCGLAPSSSSMWTSRLRSRGSPAGSSLRNTSLYSASSYWTFEGSASASTPM